MKKIFLVAVLIFSASLMYGCTKNTVPTEPISRNQNPRIVSEPIVPEENIDNNLIDNINYMVTAVIKTSKGEIEIELYGDKVPNTVTNFAKLSKEGMYDGVYFHRVIEDFMVQTGDVKARGTAGVDFIYDRDGSDKHVAGTGDAGYKFDDEFDPSLRHDGPGVLSMANSGPNTNGSQFFSTHLATPWLDDVHSVFGKVTKGQDIVDSIVQGDKIESIIINE